MVIKKKLLGGNLHSSHLIGEMPEGYEGGAPLAILHSPVHALVDARELSK